MDDECSGCLFAVAVIGLGVCAFLVTQSLCRIAAAQERAHPVQAEAAPPGGAR